ncbi:CsgG/HfaB family protein [Mesotoga sp.]|jgi:curli biogenesis system outer membrane secretion channel CsgG|uniref:CsgG/HfaB family protein n=1 Tax=Mesotoga sp. TaxID=2053577 RepID=UPI001BD20BB7|nr:CsgG/HfaB family protein [Mesotoga sp.]
MSIKKSSESSPRLLLVVVLLLAVALCCEPVVTASETEFYGPKKRVAIADVEISAPGAPRGLANGIEEMLITSLHESGRFIVLERSALEEILREQRLSLTGVIRPDTAAKVGELFGAQILVKTVVTGFAEEKIGTVQLGPLVVSIVQGYIAMDMRIFDANTGVIIESRKAESTITETGGGILIRGGMIDFTISDYEKTPLGKATREVIDKLVDFIVSEIRPVPWQGRVAIAEPSKVYVNAGFDVGMQNNSYLEIFERGREIIDPSTGLSLGFQKTGIGVAIVEEVSEKYSVASLLAGSTGSDGDIVEFVRAESVTGIIEKYKAHRPNDNREVKDGERDPVLSKSIVVMIPETHTRRRVETRIPDPAAETEIIRVLVEHGFNVVDQIKVAEIRYTEMAFAAIHDVRNAISLARQFDADMIIIGEAFSEWVEDIHNMVSCRARVEARIIDMNTGRILAADGVEGSALDVSEGIASKKALRAASTMLADYFVDQLFAQQPDEYVVMEQIEVLITGLSSYRQLMEFEEALEQIDGIAEIHRQSYAGGIARFTLRSSVTAREITDALFRWAFDSFDLDVTYFSSSKIELEAM